MSNHKKQKGKNSLRRFPSIRQKLTSRQLILVASVSGALLFLLTILFNLSDPKNAKASTSMESMNSGSFIVNMGITPQTVANGLKPYGLVYDLCHNYYVPVKWVISSAKAKDGPDFTYDGLEYNGGTFIVPAEYIDSTVSARITYWQSLGVQGVYTTSSVSVPVYMTITNYPLIMIDTLSNNQAIIMGYYTNAGIPPSAYATGAPADLSTCHDMWVNPHGDPAWSTHSYLYNFTTVQKSYIWSQCHAVSNLEGCENTSSPFQRLNFLTTTGLKCWKTTGTGPVYCGPNITETHAKNSSSPYSYYFATEPVAQFMGTLDGAVKNGSEQWYQPQSTGQWRSSTHRIVTTANGTSPGEGILMAYGYAYGDSSNGMVMYTSGHDFTSSGTTPEQVAVQRSFLNFMLLAGKARQILFSSYTIPTSFDAYQPQPVSVSVSSGIAPYTYRWTSTCPGFFGDSTAASTYFMPDNTDVTGVIRCIVTDACGRQNFISQVVTISSLPLPVTLTSFSAHVAGDVVNLRWSTSSEINNDYFTLERGLNGSEFKELARVDGAGSSTVNHYYSYTDEHPMNGISYYRLRQTDVDGNFELFNPVAVNVNHASTGISNILITPNPFTEEFKAQFNSTVSKNVTAELVTLRSKVVYSGQMHIEEGLNTFLFQSGNELERGIYVFRLLEGNTMITYAKAVKK